MSDENVVPFDPPTRGAMARRGAPDKSGPPVAGAILLRCPSCAAELRLEAEWLEGQAEVLCGRCDTEIPLVGFGQERGAG